MIFCNVNRYAEFIRIPIFFALGLEILKFPIYNTGIKWLKLKWLKLKWL